MMRTIKFRAWHKTEKAWKGLWIFRGGHVGEYNVSNEEIDILDLTNQWYNCELMQFTGLLDKNEKEIYEGDIIKNEFPEKIYIVKWLDETHEFRLNNKSLRDQLEIIGNIYDNPELIN